MSNKDSSQIQIPLGGEFYITDPATAIPDDIDAVELIRAGTTPGWEGLGWANEDGVTITQDRDVLEIPGWGSGGQSIVRRVTKRVFNFAGTLLQTNRMNVSTWFGSGDFAEDGGTTTPGFRADITIATPTVEKALLVYWMIDGHPFALAFKKVDISSDGDLSITDTAAQQYGLGITSLAPDSGSILGSVLTTHPAFDPA